jgi:hypothetical protein
MEIDNTAIVRLIATSRRGRLSRSLQDPAAKGPVTWKQSTEALPASSFGDLSALRDLSAAGFLARVLWRSAGCSANFSTRRGCADQRICGHRASQ